MYSCDAKCKTKEGVIVAASNCGIILGYREIYGSESCTQVGMFYLDITEHFKGISSLTYNIKFFLNVNKIQGIYLST